jgi:hypothetical protein
MIVGSNCPLRSFLPSENLLGKSLAMNDMATLN